MKNFNSLVRAALPLSVAMGLAGFVLAQSEAESATFAQTASPAEGTVINLVQLDMLSHKFGHDDYQERFWVMGAIATCRDVQVFGPSDEFIVSFESDDTEAKQEIGQGFTGLIEDHRANGDGRNTEEELLQYGLDGAEFAQNRPDVCDLTHWWTHT